MTKKTVVQVRVSVEEKAVWLVFAGEAGLSLSEWIRGRLNSSVSRAAVAELPAGPASVHPAVKEAVGKRERVVAEKVLERFVVPASCPAPNTKKSFRPDFK